jgi:hypothetical protein
MMTEPEPVPAMGQKRLEFAAMATRDRPEVVTTIAAATLVGCRPTRLGVEGGTGENFENAEDRFAESMMKPEAKPRWYWKRRTKNADVCKRNDPYTEG